MRTTITRLALAAALPLTGLAVTSPARAAGCSGDDGVTVVVQHAGSTRTGCADGDPDDAGQALESAGFTVESVRSDPKLLCRIDDAPKTSCEKAPEAETFWGFFTASDGGTWEFADEGVFDLDPEPGTTLGFRFGDGTEPTVTPEEARAEVTSPQEESPEGADGGDEDGGTTPSVITGVGVGLVVVLGVAGVVAARRRR